MEKTNVTKNEKREYEMQAVVSSINEDSFVFLRKTKAGHTIVSPYVAYEDDTPEGTEFRSDLEVITRRQHRIENLFSCIPTISSYIITNDCIIFDCLKGVPPSSFPKNAINGWCHFHHTTEIKREKNQRPTIINKIEPRSFFEKVSIEEKDQLKFEFEQTNKISFKTNDMKVFPVFFQSGFAIAVANERNATLWITMQDKEKMLCGISSSTEVDNFVHNIFPLFQIFSININDRASTIFLKNLGVLRNILRQVNENKLMIKFEYQFENPKKCIMSIIGYGI